MFLWCHLVLYSITNSRGFQLLARSLFRQATTDLAYFVCVVCWHCRFGGVLQSFIPDHLSVLFDFLVPTVFVNKPWFLASVSVCRFGVVRVIQFWSIGAGYKYLLTT